MGDEAQESRGNTYNETLRKVQESLSQTITDQQRQFSEAQENRIREFTAAQTDSEKRLTELVSDYTKRLTDQDAEFAKQRVGLGADATKRLEELQKNYSDQADGILKKINMHREEVQTLVGVIATLGVTSGYQKTADSARKRMMLWQGVGVVALVAVILFAYKAFLPSMQGDFKWGSFATRVFLTVTVGVLAAYSVSQGDRSFTRRSTTEGWR